MIVRALLLIIVMLCATACKAKRDAFIVHNATLLSFAQSPRLPAPMSDRDELARASLRGHYIVAGTGTVIGYRSWSPGSLSAIDDEGFEKITIFLSRPLSSDSEVAEVSHDGTVIINYTHGGSVWPQHACFGTAHAGTFSRKRDLFDRTTLEVRFDVRLTSMLFPDFCDATHVVRKFNITERSLDELTPWLGRPGNHPYDETYP